MTDRRFAVPMTEKVTAKPAQADVNRKERRALVKALGNRQFKKLYRKAQA